MRLDDDECAVRLRAADHGVLCTTGAPGVVDAVPVCFAVAAGVLASPVDRVKPKRTTELVRLRNLEREPRATLLCEGWDPQDWSHLWWVRARLVLRPGAQVGPALRDACEEALRAKYAPYAGAAFAGVLVFDLAGLTGWAAGAPPRPAPDPDPLR